MLREYSNDREEYPLLPANLSDIPSPKTNLRERMSEAPDTSLTNPAYKGSNTPNQSTKEHAKKVCLAITSNRGNDSQFSEKNQKEILWNFALDGSQNCDALYLTRPTSSGQRSQDLGHCPKCGKIYRYRCSCDSPKCAQKFCAQNYGIEKGEIVADKISAIKDWSRYPNIGMYHVFLSPPPELAPYWAQWGQYLEEMYFIAHKFLSEGLRASGYTLVAHTHRGRKKDYDLREASRWIGIEDPEDTEGGPYWRVGFHFHSVAMVFNPRSPQYLKSLCREFYNLTGWVIKIKTINDTPEKVIQYQLSHAGLPTRAGAKRSMPAIRFYGTFAPTKLRKIELGFIIRGRKCPEDNTPVNVYAKHGVPNTVHTKLHAYMPVFPHGVPNPSLDMVKEILSEIPLVPYWSPTGKRIYQRILNKSDIVRLLAVPELKIPSRLIPDLDKLYSADPYEPDDIDDGDLPPVTTWIEDEPSEDPAEDPPEISPELPPSGPSRLGQQFDLSEIAEYCPGSRFLQLHTEAIADISHRDRLRAGPDPGGPPEAEPREGGPVPTAPEGTEAHSGRAVQGGAHRPPGAVV